MPSRRQVLPRPATTLLVVVLALAALTIAPARASAHVPVLEPDRRSGEVTIRPPDVSLALYGYLSDEETVDTYVFEVPRLVETTVGIIVPARDDLEAFHPAVAVLDADGQPVAELLMQPGPVFFEPFSLETFYQGPEARVSLRPGVRYRLEVKRPVLPPFAGDYVVTFSGPERFSGTDSARAVAALPRVWLGLYGGGPVRPVSLAVFALLVMAVAGLIHVARRRAARR